jgi:hypothetical protein
MTRWQGWFAAIAAMLVTAGLVILDVSDAGLRRWWVAHALTTDTVAGLLVLLVTFLVVDRVVRMRQVRDRSLAMAAQTAIMVGQATRATKAVSAVLNGSGDRDAAADEVRTYMIMLLVGAPVLIDARVSRNFLEQAQHLGGEMARALATISKSPGNAATVPSDRLDDAFKRVRAASVPLLQLLSPQEQIAASGDESQ